MSEWFKSLKSKLVVALGALATLLLVYFIGRRNSKGEVNVAVAQRELELANQQHDKLQDRLADLHTRQTDIVADILAEETARISASNKELTDDEIIDRLRTDHLIK